MRNSLAGRAHRVAGKGRRAGTVALALALAGSLGGTALANKKQNPGAKKEATPAATPATGPELAPEQPEILTEGPEIPTQGEKSQVDLANLVTSAAKSVTTVQEAPSIVTVITAEEMKRRGFRFVTQAMTDVPGWLHWPGEGHGVNSPLVRGTTVSTLMMRDGVPLNSPWENTYTYHLAMPIETIKRIEVVTGPGGVLWGANSFLGIFNIINKDADDVNGLEVSAGYGDGSGFQSAFKAYGMFGKSFLGGKLKIFQHVSYDNFVGPEFTMLQNVLSSPAPQPNGAIYYASELTSKIPRSYLLNIDGKYTVGPISLIYNLPMAEIHRQLTFPSTVVHTGLPNNVGPSDPSGLPSGTERPYNPTDANDPRKAARDHQVGWFERYAILEYKGRALEDRFGLTAKGYLVDLERDMPYFGVFTPSKLLEGGLTFRVNHRVQRFGGSVDTDLAITPTVRLLVGGESFQEIQRGSKADFTAPYDVGRLPFSCPRDANGFITSNLDQPVPPGTTPQCQVQFVFDADRTVAGGFADVQARPHPKLTLDGGVRVQRAWGKRPYDPQLILSGAAVVNFLTDWHLKLNYAEGFRAPAFIATDANGRAVNYAGTPTLRPEKSQSVQGEVNGRLLRNVRRVRELAVRADYSYTVLEDLIILKDGRWANAGKRGIHSAETLAKLYLQGDHALSFGYTYLDVATDDRGLQRSLPNHWFSGGAVFSAIKNHLDFNANVQVIGSHEDPNRTPDETSASALPGLRPAGPSDLSLDRLPPTAYLHLGLRIKNLIDNRLDISANVYNLLDQRYFYVDGFNELSPRLELLPLPAEGISAFASATLKL